MEKTGNTEPGAKPAKPKRLDIAKGVLRELYLKSGNQCAFPTCEHPVINASGDYVAELCHIEAVSELGQRFNPHQTDKERAAFENLLLMCHAHHAETNNVEGFPVERMRQIKADHEAKFSDVIGLIRRPVADMTQSTAIKPPKDLKNLDAALKWNLGEAEMTHTLALISSLAERVGHLPSRARELLAIIISRSRSRGTSLDLRISEVEVKESSNQSDSVIDGLIKILRDHRFIETLYEDEDHPLLGLRRLGDD